MQRERLSANAPAVKDLVKNSAPKDVDGVVFAALTLTANVLLNLDETFTKE